MENQKEFVYEGSELEERLKASIRDIFEDRLRLKKLFDSRLRNTSRTAGRTERLHQEILSTMRRIIPEDYRAGLETEVYLKPEGLMTGEGLGYTSKKNGKRVIIINEEVLKGQTSVNYGRFFTHNLQGGKRVNPEDLFKNVVAHEYGHILFGDGISRDATWNLPYGLLGKSLVCLDDGELSEGFAFWFGDTVSDTKTPITEVADFYRYRLDPRKIVEVYMELQEITRDMGAMEVMRQMPQYMTDKLKEYNL